jgi:FSR family fosmidomycin resistance protein-like MFS transporter
MATVAPRPDPAFVSNPAAGFPVSTTSLTLLVALSFSHLLNDTMQSLLPAVYPLLKGAYHLSYAQIGLITLTNQGTGSILQPVVGTYTDRYPKPYSLAIGMAFTLIGLVLLALASSFGVILLAAIFIGLGSSVFHPEASRVAHRASGGRHGFAQSIFQVGGNMGTSIGPLLAALILGPGKQYRILWFSLLAFTGIIVLTQIGHWYKRNMARASGQRKDQRPDTGLSRRRTLISLAILVALMFSKFFYLASMTSYFTFFLISKFHLSVQASQFHLFIFLFAVAAGTIIGGPLGDRFGRKRVIWTSILGVAPFSLLLPHVDLFWITVLTMVIGITLASAFPAIIVYAQELVPGKVGMIAGLFFGLAFGMGGIGSAVLGKLADHTSINFVFGICSFLPLIGLLTGFLPNLKRAKAHA